MLAYTAISIALDVAINPCEDVLHQTATVVCHDKVYASLLDLTIHGVGGLYPHCLTMRSHVAYIANVLCDVFCSLAIIAVSCAVFCSSINRAE